MSRSGTSSLGANAGRSRTHNRQLVLGRLRQAGQAGRADLARATGLTIQAVSNIIAELADEGLVVDTGARAGGRGKGGRGQPAALYALEPCGGYALGFELRPDALFAALLRLDGGCLFSAREDLASDDPAQVLAQAVSLKTRALAEAGAAAGRLMGAGVVMPGPFDATGISGIGTELPRWRGRNAAALFGEALGLEALVENDANAAAMAERITGAARDLQCWAFLYFGAGLGLGIVNGGRLIRGGFGNAGEIGHVGVQGPQGRAALETLLSRHSLARHLAPLGIAARDSAALAAAYRSEPEAFAPWMSGAVGALEQAVEMIENLLDPQAVILGGAMPDAMLDDLVARATLPERSVANRPGRTTPRLIRGGSGRMTATLGAAAMVLNSVFTPHFADAR